MRIEGPKWGHGTFKGGHHGLIVAPKTHGKAKSNALQAAMRALARRHQLDVFPADPVTGPGVRRVLENGSVFTHLEGIQGESVALDDGLVPISRIGLNSTSWLVFASGIKGSATAARRLREHGVANTLGLQFELEPYQVAAAHRSFYRALSTGESIGSALLATRVELSRITGNNPLAWAAPVLYTAPVDHGTEMPSQASFPPVSEFAASLEENALPSPSSVGQPHESILSRPGAPMSAAVFVTETLRALSLGLGSPEERQLRASALKELGGHQHVSPASIDNMSPAERINILADALIDSLASPDEYLGRPQDYESTLERVAERQAVPLENVRRIASAIRAHRMVCVVGADMSGTSALASAICSDVYGFHPRLTIAGGGALLTTPRVNTATASGSPGGTLCRTVASNWRRDEIDFFQPEQADPQSRMPLVSRHATGWRIYKGGWLVIPNSELMSETVLVALNQALERGVLELTSSDGHPIRLAVPQDFRIVLCARWEPAGLALSTPTIPVQCAFNLSAMERWLAVAESRVGPPLDSAAANARRIAAEQLRVLGGLLGLVCEPSHTLMQGALCDAIISGGEPRKAATCALQSHLTGRFGMQPPHVGQYVMQVVSHTSAGPLRVAVKLLRAGGYDSGVYALFGTHSGSSNDVLQQRYNH